MQCRSSPEGPPSRCLDPTISVSPSAAGWGGQDIEDPYGINLRSAPDRWCGTCAAPPPPSPTGWGRLQHKPRDLRGPLFSNFPDALPCKRTLPRLKPSSASTRHRCRPLSSALCAVAFLSARAPYKGHSCTPQPRGVGRPQSGTRGRPAGAPPLCDIPSGCCSFTGPWTVTRSSLRMLRRVAAFCRPLRPVLLLVSFPRSRSPVAGVLGLCCMWHGVPFARQRRPIIGVLRMCWLLPGSFDCFCCPHTSVRP